MGQHGVGLAAVAALFLPGLPGAAVSPAALPAFAPAEDDEGIAVPILMYHGILKDSSWNACVISPAELESDLKYLRRAGYTTIGIPGPTYLLIWIAATAGSFPSTSPC